MKMRDLNKLFRARIGFSENDEITFDKLSDVLEKTANTIPFENICIINNNIKEISKVNVVDKILKKKEGGLCYELNSILYYFLLENRFDVELISAVVFEQSLQTFSPTGRTHVAILLTYNGEQYIIDTGFGGNLPLTPVPMNGQVVSSRNGDFRVRKKVTDHGNYVMEMKLKHRHSDWVLGYAFDPSIRIKNELELNEIQKIIVEHPFSPFNKKFLVTKLIDNGVVVLTDTSFTQRIAGNELKEEITPDKFKLLAKKYFGLNI
jgi:N-hydroxyarylamine O-acetyltransferase